MGKKQKGIIPVWLDELRRTTPRVLTLAAQDRELIQIIDIDEKINQVQSKDKISVKLRLSSSSTPGMVVIRRDGKEEPGIPVETAFNLTLMDIVKCLFHAKQYDFIECENAPALLVAYEEVKDNPSEISRMQRKTTVHAPEIQRFGRFDDVMVDGLRLLPRTLEDAGNWARDRVIDGITTYTDEVSYDQLCDREATRFSERFDQDQVKSRLPTYQEMLTIVEEQREKDPSNYWFVTAPVLLTFRKGI